MAARSTGLAGRARTLAGTGNGPIAAFVDALAHDADQQARSAYIRLFQTEGRAEQVLLADGATRLRAMFGDLDRSVVDNYARAMGEPGALTAALNWYRALPHAPGTGPVTVPTTYLWSDRDIAVGRVAAERCGGHVTGPYRMVELTGVSHWVPEQAPDALARAVLDQVDSSGRDSR